VPAPHHCRYHNKSFNRWGLGMVGMVRGRPYGWWDAGMVRGGHETAPLRVGCGDGAGRAQDRAPTGWWCLMNLFANWWDYCQYIAGYSAIPNRFARFVRNNYAATIFCEMVPNLCCLLHRYIYG
jgi:hypothetical protein